MKVGLDLAVLQPFQVSVSSFIYLKTRFRGPYYECSVWIYRLIATGFLLLSWEGTGARIFVLDK